MRTASKALCFFVVLVIVLSPARAASQIGPSSSTVTARYDPQSEIRVKGIVVGASEFLSAGLGAAEFHLVLQTRDGTMEIYLAASKLIAQYGLTFAPGQEIDVVGSRVVLEGREALLAREITRGEEVFVFRDAKGKPIGD